MFLRILRYLGYPLFLFAVPLFAYAYLDPGTMSYFIQMMVGVVAGLGIAVKLFWSNIKLFFLKITGQNKKQSRDEKDEKSAEGNN